MNLLLQVIWFLIPAGVANLVPPVAARLLPRWETPMDFGLHWRGQQLLGSHKTLRGLLTGTLMATVAHHFQVLLAEEFSRLDGLAVSPLFYEYWWMGTWLGFTALLGDGLKSLIKRQLRIAPGRPWLPWDKIDWIIGCLLGSWFLFPFSTGFVLAALATGLVLSVLGRIAGYWLNINKDWL